MAPKSVEPQARGVLELVLVNLSFDPPRTSTACAEEQQTEDKSGRFCDGAEKARPPAGPILIPRNFLTTNMPTTDILPFHF